MAERRNATETYVQTQLGLYVPKSLYDANTVLAATTDDTPAAITMGASTTLARLAAGNIVAASDSQMRTMLSLVPGTNFIKGGSGTSFPGSPATDDVFYRTDTDLLFFYDGTRWLTLNRYVFNFPLVNGATGSDYGSQIQTYPVLDMWLEATYYTVYVSTTNNGSNYWSIQPKKSDVAAGATSLGTAINTSAGAANVRLQFSITMGAALGSGATWPVVFNEALKAVGNPGALSYNSLLAFRLIGA